MPVEMDPYPNEDVERMALITLQIWCTGDTKGLSDLDDFPTPSQWEINEATRFTDFVVPAVSEYIAKHWVDEPPRN